MGSVIGFIVSAIVSAFTAAAVAKAVVSVVIGIGLSLLSKSFAKKPKTPSFSQQLVDRTLTARQPIMNRRYIYGIARVGGAYTFIHVTGSNKEYLHLVITIAGHQVEEILAMYFDGKEIPLTDDGTPVSDLENFEYATDTRGSFHDVEQVITDQADADIYTNNVRSDINYSNHVRVRYNLGSDNQAAFSDLIDECPEKWTTAHQQRGCASAYVRLKYDSDRFPNGIPSISFLVKGKNDIYDPRDASTGYTANAALVVADYLSIDEPLGVGAEYGTEIDATALIEAANICDEPVDLNAGGDTEARYRIDGSFDESTPSQIIEELTGAMAGAVIMQGNRFIIRAGAYRTPTVTLSEDNIVGPVSVQTMVPLSDNFNGVRGVFVDPNKVFQPTDFPAVQVSEYVTIDDNWESWADLELNYTMSPQGAQRIARALLEQNRRAVKVNLTVDATGFQLQPWDTVMLSIDKYGWSSKSFLVAHIEIDPNAAWSVNLELRETDSDIYTWTYSNAQTPTYSPGLTLPDPFTVGVPGVSVSDEIVTLNSGTPGAQLVVTVTEASDVFVLEYEVQYKKSAASVWGFGGRSQGDVFYIPSVEDGVEYDVRVRAINAAGVRGAWITASNHQVVGTSEVPSDVADFSIEIQDRTGTLRWTPSTDLDLSHYSVRFTPVTTGATWAGAQQLVKRVAKPANTVSVPALVGTYLIKAFDYGGRESATETLIVNEVDATLTFDAVETYTQEPDWDGTHDGTAANGSGYLSVAPIGGDLFGDLSDFFEPDNFFTTTDTYESSGTYTVGDTLDLGAKYTSRVIGSVRAYGENVSANFFAPDDFFAPDELLNVTSSNWDVTLQIRTTDDDPNGSPVWSDWSDMITGDYAFRACQFRIVLNSIVTNVVPVVTNLSFTVDMPERTIAGNDLSVSVAGRTITFTDPFRVLGGLSIAAQNLQPGDYASITDKDGDGFTIIFRDQSNVAVARTVDYVAHGYGKGLT